MSWIVEGVHQQSLGKCSR